MKTKIRTVMVALAAALLGLGLLVDAAAAAEGVRRGLIICGGVLIPALFPFMVLCCFLVDTQASRILSLPLSPLTTRVFKLPSELGATVLLSFIGGYPVGAKMISKLLSRGRIDAATARRMLCFCVNASPSFLISAVGVGMLANRRAGAVLFAAQTLAALCIGAVISFKVRQPKVKPMTYTSGKGAFVPAVADASSAMLGMCAYAVLFSGLLSTLLGRGIPALLSDALGLDPAYAIAFFAGLFEVTGGSYSASMLGGESAIAAVSLCCSWGGLSVIFQVISFFKDKSPGFGLFLLCRLAHCVLALWFSLVLYRLLCADMPVWLPTTPPAPKIDPLTVVATLSLLGMCSILVFESCKHRKRGSVMS